MKCLPLFILLLNLTPLAAQTDNFEDGNDNGWTRFTPLAPLGVTTINYPNGGYRLACNPSPNPATYGPARVASFRLAEVYLDFAACVDFTAWNEVQDTSLGLFGRIQANPAPGQVSAYVLTYQGNDRDFEINRVENESPLKINPVSVNVVLDPAKIYRMVFFGVGAHLEGRIYDRDQPLLPLAVVTATDTTFPSGRNGLIVFSGKNTAIGATFDNYRADHGAPPPLTIQSTPAGGVAVSYNTELGLPWRLESSVSLTSWSPQEPDRLEGSLTQFRLSAGDRAANAKQFFRLAKGPVPAP